MRWKQSPRLGPRRDHRVPHRLAYAVIENTNTSNTYSHSQRSNVLEFPEKQGQWRDNVKGETFFNTALFSAPGAGIFGNAPAAFCCGPGVANIDFSAQVVQHRAV
ncbi:MAG: hypothetical protein R2748_02935 [Bryobacterales bacterium]